MSLTGIVILDNNSLGDLAAAGALDAVLGSFRASGLTPLVTMHNMVEAIPAAAHQRTVLLRTIERIAAVGGMLPWTFELLRISGAAALQSEGTFPVPLSEPVVELDEATFADARIQFLEVAERLNRATRERHAGARQVIQPFLTEKNLRGRWDDLSEFMRQFWDRLDLREQFADQLWEQLGFQEPRPPDLLQRSETWKLMIDADGVEVFQGAVAFRQPRQVQRMDLLQLPYLAGAGQRVLVTRDRAFGAAVKALAHGRYPGTRVCTPAEILALAV